ncbi:glycyl-tRNA synthetase subunit beta [Hylemonella gracilis str. Niagara R]|uniref:Glycine--tRNA ligase beta subunit n=1 Tax=Hylemonella gracilis str. Niagara R TaxID=1458275 RepID=A0A016XLE8_9BURK|nr:glycine--tRNA ligase subunit beta [Hylemonella gracilis]EYC52725.1 glycyl-tRNA synthetase subunit beta [Hylemonella gracilis str. Niagara R]
MSMNNLLVELFVEELPPKALKKLGEAFSTVLLDQLKAQGLASADSVVTPYASPRRLGAHVTQVLTQAPDEELLQKLVPVSVGLKDGQATDALRKRLAKEGRGHLADMWPNAKDGPDELFIQNDGKVDAFYLRGLAKGTSLSNGVQVALDEAIQKLPIPKVMSYQLETDCELPGWSSVNFVRPAHGLVALHGSAVVSVQALGLRAGNSTRGHRFEAKKDVVVLKDADSYAATLREDGAVIASFAERRAEIVRQLAAAAAKVGGGVRPIEDEALLDEVTALVERPNVLVCEFEKEFLAVPQECLILTMKANQKYFPLLDAAGKLTNKFLVVSNISPADASAVIGGNERVVRPRLADAKFFFDQDRKKTLESRVEGLGKVVYHNKLGTQGERMERVRAIAKAIAQQLGDAKLVAAADTAARLAKTDLLTDMVGEFPELQGIMGGYYARHDGLGEEIAQAIEDHYKPRFAGDDLPRNTVGLVVALADKLETLVGMFGIGNLPTGDKDPFALRRHALGVIRMLVEKELPLDLREVLSIASNACFATLKNSADVSFLKNIANAVELEDLIYKTCGEFMMERLGGSLREQGFTSQEVEAVLSLEPSRLADVPKRLTAVRAFVALPEAAALAAANKRIGNILKKAEGTVEAKVDAQLLKEPAEQALHGALHSVQPLADKLYANGEYAASLRELAVLKAPVDAFFDGVMVNAEDAALRANRLGLLKSLHEAMNRVADLSRLAA